MLGLFNETVELTATDTAQSWTPPGQPAVNHFQDQSWQGVYLVTTDGPAHILRITPSNPDDTVTPSIGARLIADWPMLFVLNMGDTLEYIRGADATDDAHMWITKVTAK